MDLGLSLQLFSGKSLNADNALQKIIKENAYLKAINKKKSEFLSMAIHDMANPLGYISGILEDSLQIINQKTIDLNEISQNLQNAMKAFDKINYLIKDIQTVNSIEMKQFELRKVPCDINDLISESIKLYDPIARRKNITINFDEIESLPKIQIDPNKILSVLENIIGNAIKYSYPDSKIDLAVRKEGGSIIVSCKDWGQGLYPEEVLELFSGFKKFSARPTAGETSSGMGLMIIKRLVEMHGGKVWAESKKNEGSIFSFSLPIKLRRKKFH